MAHKKNTTNLTELLLQCVTRSSRLGLLHLCCYENAIYILKKKYSGLQSKQRDYPEFCVTAKMRCKK